MARVTVYVPDALKALMDPMGDKINWSNVAQTAFQAEVQRFGFMKEITMQSVIERLRASKEEFGTTQLAEGKAHGTRWAMKTAAYHQLVQLSSLDLDECPEGQPLAKFFELCLNPEFSYRNAEEGFWAAENGYEPPSDEYVRGFVEGAQEVWEEVSDQI